MARVVGPVAPPPTLMGLDYVFTEGTAAPYDVMYDYIGNEGAPVSIAQCDHAFVTAYCSVRKLVRTRDGTLYAVYNKTLAGVHQLYVKKSVDDGATWTDETRISTYAGMQNYYQRDGSIAVDSSDHLHVVWRGMATGYTTRNQIWYAKYTTSWAPPVRISTVAGMATNTQGPPGIAVDSSDYLHVVWVGLTISPPANYQVWYNKYTGSWAGPVRISTYTNMATYPQYMPGIAVDSSDHLHVVWFGKATGYTTIYQIWYAEYTDSWVTPVRISTYTNMATYNQWDPSIAVDASDHLHVVWHGKATGFTTVDQIWYAKYTTSWVAPVRISTYTNMATYAQTYPSIAVDDDDYLHVLWGGKATGYTNYDKIWHAEYTDSWATPEVLQPIGQNKHPNIRWSRWP